MFYISKKFRLRNRVGRTLILLRFCITHLKNDETLAKFSDAYLSNFKFDKSTVYAHFSYSILLHPWLKVFL